MPMPIPPTTTIPSNQPCRPRKRRPPPHTVSLPNNHTNCHQSPPQPSLTVPYHVLHRPALPCHRVELVSWVLRKEQQWCLVLLATASAPAPFPFLSPFLLRRSLSLSLMKKVLRKGPLPLGQFIRYMELIAEQVKNSLLFLDQHNCVQAYVLADDCIHAFCLLSFYFSYFYFLGQ